MFENIFDKERELTSKEKDRLNNLDLINNKMYDKGYKKRELTISIKLANVMAAVIGIPICFMYGYCFYIYNGGIRYEYSLTKCILYLVLFLALTVVHEIILGLFWGIFSKNHFKDIEFGYIKEYMTPYCTCLVPLNKAQYILGAIMPGVILGIIPMYISIFTGSFDCFILAAAMTLGAGGDFLIIIKLLFYRSNKKDKVFLDHPTECGLLVFEK